VGAALRWASPPCTIVRPVPIVICDPHRCNRPHAVARDVCTCVHMSGGPAPRPPEAHHCPITMSAPGRRASHLQVEGITSTHLQSHLQVVVTQARRLSKNGGKLVAEADQRHHDTDTMLVQCHGGLRGRSAHLAQARGRALGRSPLCLSVFCSTSPLFD